METGQVGHLGLKVPANVVLMEVAMRVGPGPGPDPALIQRQRMEEWIVLVMAQ